MTLTKKIGSLILLACCTMMLQAKTIYLNTGGYQYWLKDSPAFFVHSWGKEDQDKQMSLLYDDIYFVDIPDANNNIIFLRQDGKSTSVDWDNYWNKTGDLSIPSNKNCYKITDWGSGEWIQYSEPTCHPAYGLLIDGVYKGGKRNLKQTGWTEYYLRDIKLAKGQKIQVYDSCNNAAWAISKYAATSFEFPIQNNKYIVSEDGTYDFYIKFIYENDEMYIAQHGFYGSSVPSQCTDVMMQAFFNESYNNDAPGVSKVGNTKWTTLLPQAEEIGAYFDLVWLPPSANGEGMGYHPYNYSNQNSNWGSRAELEALIGALHDAGAKVVADIVINHCQSSSGWCSFPEFDFGEYGKFNPTCSWICSNDEVNKDPKSDCQGKATGSEDDGENWDGARDWAHDMPEVQNMFKAYLKWMRNVMKYDGFRYDKGDGFNNWHHDNYNKAAGPYIAFMECYTNTSQIEDRLKEANYNMMALDFDTKWHVFDKMAGWDYVGRGGGLLGQNWGKHAVTFIDSHDWFLRSDNENEFGGRGNSLTEALLCRLLGANAFILSMPGVPCVFYPHWAKYKEFIKPMIEARKLAGIHSESEVKDEQWDKDGDRHCGYQATIVGKNDGYLILCLGTKAHQKGFEGYKLKASYYRTWEGRDESYQIWVNKGNNQDSATRIEDTNASALKAEKFLQNGQLFIRLGDTTYDILGNIIK